MAGRRQTASRVLPRPSGRGDAFEQWPADVEFGVLRELMGYALRRAQIAIYEDFFATVEDLDITPPMFSSMVLIRNNPGLRQSSLGRIVGIARSGTMTLVDRLERAGLVQRLSVPGDRRVNELALTDHGNTVLDELIRRIRAHDDRVSAGLTDDEKVTLRALLARF
ncbi:MarR family transcriptional regulator [Tistrella sp. BH-R2-4]|uniref:MarR family transcriptional regulator n=1 Tax=Tistrella arctica TaxID=3133430 RepID=A0ABU9YFR7_9PROT